MADVTLTLAAKDTGLSATLQRIQSRLANFNNSMGGVSAMSAKVSGSFTGLARSVVGLAAAYAGVSQAISAFNNALDTAGRLNDLSETTGETAGNLALLERAFENNGISGERLGPLLGKMSGFVNDLANNSGRAATVASQLGVSFADLAGKTPTQQLQVLLQALAKIPDATTRSALAGDIFGDRLGNKLIPLAKNFAGSIEEARGELGSLVGILDANGASLDQLGDKLKNSVGNKLTELAIGFLAGVKGANDLADALSRIDAAGAGLDMGRIFSGAMQEPGQAFVAVGEMLLLAVQKAGNELINATMHAARVYADALTSLTLWNGVSDMLAGALGGIENFLTRSFLSAIKTGILEPLASLPTILGGGVYKGLLGQFEKLQGFLDKEAQTFNANLSDGAGKIGRAINQSMQSVPRADRDYLGAGNQSQEVAGALDRLRNAGGSPPFGNQGAQQSSAEPARQSSEELNRIYNEQARAIESANLSHEQYTQKIKALNDWMNSSMFGGAAVPAMNVTPPSVPVGQTLGSSPDESDSSAKNQATETTLQKVASFLEDLTTKLPQAALV